MNKIAAAIILTIACTCFASAGPLDGTWLNTDQSTISIPKIRIVSTSKDGSQMEWWGKMEPQDIKRGPLRLQLLGDSTGDKSPDKHGYATEDCGFADKVFFITISGDHLVVECLTLFKADDKLVRSNYRERLTFKRQQ